MDFPTASEFSSYIDKVHKLHDYKKDFWELARSLGIPVAPGKFSMTAYVPGPVITLEEYLFYSPKTFTKMHEVAHVFLRDSGIAQRLWDNAEIPEEYTAQAEAYCNFGAAQLQMTNEDLREAIELFGDSPRAILHLMKAGGYIDPKVAARRFVFGEMNDDPRRAAFILRNDQVKDVSTANMSVPFTIGEQVKQIEILVPDAKLLLLSKEERLIFGTIVRDW